MHAGKPGEIVTDSMKMSQQDQDTVKRRILIALGLSAATVAFALVPAELLDGRGDKPASTYLVPVLRSIVRPRCSCPACTCHW